MKFPILHIPILHGLTVALIATAAGACGGGDSSESPMVMPAYNETTGRLERLTSDKNGDGKMDTWAFMDGPVLKYIELDRNGDGKADRWEYYEPKPASSDPSDVVIVRAEERSTPGEPITRQEFYEGGVLQRVEEDTNADGRVNRWEQHVAGRLVRMDLDLKGRGTADRRLIYEPGGSIRTEVDPDGDGVFEPAPKTKAP